MDPERPDYPREIFESVETALKYEGYIKRQLQDIAEMRRLEKPGFAERNRLRADCRPAA